MDRKPPSRCYRSTGSTFIRDGTFDVVDRVEEVAED